MTLVFRTLALILLTTVLSGCASPLYYTQAVSGQIELLMKRRPVEEVVADPATSPETRRQLELVQRVRDFASQELALPDNYSYRTYADLERPFAVWNVYAAPELSLEPKRWCFLVAGCVPYRGYFARDQAEQFAASLKQKGYDVYVGGVLAYSTLGWFNDPLLNTFIQRPEADLAGLLFHELAHQKIYVSGDSAFNESFATVIELEGVKRWFQQSGNAKEAEAYRQKIQRREEFAALVQKHRARLKEIYDSTVSDAEKRAAKARVFEELRDDYEKLKSGWNGDAVFDSWFKQDLNNAHLAAIGLYSRYVAVFQKLLAQQAGNLAAFYGAVEEIKSMPAAERDVVLQKFGGSEN
ncbi:MAG TPA: aminopeptidase [Sulfuricaulis sp.]|nr:aminopeptidase [Sulfuricaulis sp.]